MEIELPEDPVNDISSSVAAIDTVEGAVRGIHRQSGNAKTLAIWGDDGDARCGTETDVFESAQLLGHTVDPLGIGHLWVEDGPGVVQDDEHLVGG